MDEARAASNPNLNMEWHGWNENEDFRLGSPFCHAADNLIVFDEPGLFLVSGYLPTTMRYRALEESGVVYMRWDTQITLQNSGMPSYSGIVAARTQRVWAPGAPDVDPSTVLSIPWWWHWVSSAERLFGLVVITDNEVEAAVGVRASTYADIVVNGVLPNYDTPSTEQQRRIVFNAGSVAPMYIDPETGLQFGTHTEQDALDTTYHFDGVVDTAMWGFTSDFDICKISDEFGFRFDPGGGTG